MGRPSPSLRSATPMKASSEDKKGYRRLLPSLTALVEFEAAARLHSFTKAADELGVTQPAVSRQVRTLEEMLGVPLFYRHHRAIALTSEGEALYAVVAESMQRIAGAFDRIAGGQHMQEVVLVTTAAFSRFRLMPRLADLKRVQPQLKLRLTTQMFTADLRHNEVDLSVRYGNGKWGDGTSILLYDEEVFPVCSPAWLRANQAPQTLADLAHAPLIESLTNSEGWMGWDEWFQLAGAPKQKLDFSLQCSLYTDAIHATLLGQGITLGWSRMLHELVRDGELVRLTTMSVNPRNAYYAVVPHSRGTTHTVDQLITWLQNDLQD